MAKKKTEKKETKRVLKKFVFEGKNIIEAENLQKAIDKYNS